VLHQAAPAADPGADARPLPIVKTVAEQDTYMCAFYGDEVAMNVPGIGVLMEIGTPHDIGTQGMQAHRTCLLKHLDPRIPLGLALDGVSRSVVCGSREIRRWLPVLVSFS
jgi:hypothetical protein